MKVRVTFTLDVDAEAWAHEYGVASSEVRKDVQSYCGEAAWSHLSDMGLLIRGE